MIIPLYDVPNVLYKYRDWGNANHRKLIEEQELYFASVDQFNDPFDGTIPFRYDPKELTEDNIFKKYYRITKREFPYWTNTQIHEDCYRHQQMGHFHDEKYLEDFEVDTLKSINDTYGIVSLCKAKDNFLLWSHYANSHTGFCVGFDKNLLFEDTAASFAHMQYEDDLPVLGLFEDVMQTMTKLIGTKSNTWKYEDEYRLTKIYHSRKIAKLKKETIVEIVLGCKMNQQEKFKIIDLAAALYPDASVFDINLSKKKFEIELLKIR